MAKTKISEYDSTAANNTDIDSINIAEGMAPSNVNNAIRELMAHLKDGLGAGTPVFLDQTNDRVGIGTTSINRKLEIAGNNNGGAKANYIRITDTDTSATAGNQQGGIEFYTSDSGNENVTASIENLYAGSGGGSELTFNTAPSGSSGVSEAMRIDESGNVGVGVAPTTSYGNVLQIHDTGTSGANLRLTDNTSGSGTGNGFEIIQIGANNYTINRENGFIATYTNGSEAMRIDSNGKVGIGLTNATDYFADNLVVEAPAEGGITIASTATTNNAYLMFADGTSGNAAYRGYIAYAHNSPENLQLVSYGYMRFFTSADGSTATERIRINANGNVHIADNQNGADAALHIEKTTPQLRLQINGNSGYNTIESGGSNELIFGRSGAEHMRVLSGGGLTFNGDTATANALDDYEEGTWTPACTGSLSIAGAGAGARYVKIGNYVNVSLYVTSINPTADDNVFKITGLPYSVKTATGYYVAGSIGYTGDNNLNDVTAITGTSLSHIYFHLNDGDHNALTGNGMRAKGMTGASLDALIISISYCTA